MIKIQIKPGHKMDGEGESLGKDYLGNNYTYWRATSEMEVPIDLAIKLELEQPQRFQIANRSYAQTLLSMINLNSKEVITEKVIEKVVEVPVEKIVYIEKPIEKLNNTISLNELHLMPNKDAINDWAAKRGYDITTTWTRPKMILELCEQIEKRTGVKVV